MRLLTALLITALSIPLQAASKPNIVIIFADDLGYADVGCFGAKNWQTPNLDQMAKEGRKFSSFYVAQPVCSASRAALLTGCYPNRVGISGALFPAAKIGLHEQEMTLGNLCKRQGYVTQAIGKWHLGHLPQFLPTRRGFDGYLGLPYSNDMWPHHPEAKTGAYPNLPLIENEKIINGDVKAEDQAKLTEQYTQRAVEFIQANKTKPFFLYLAHSMPHVPLFPGAAFKGKSKGGTYGDVIEEIDASVGRILKTIKDNGLDENTIVIFTSDNGPWLSYGNHGGSAGPLREGKGTCWEGGVRVPCIARWPGHFPANTTCDEPIMTIDIMPTMAKWIDGELPKLKIDGLDCRALFEGTPNAKSPHDHYCFYFRDNQLHAVRSGQWKLMLPHAYNTMNEQPAGKDGKPGKYLSIKIETPELYDLVNDIGEKKNVAEANKDIVAAIMKKVTAIRNDLGDSLTKNPGQGRRKAGE